VEAPPLEPDDPPGPEDLLIRRSWWVFVGSLAVLGLLTLARLAGGASALDLLALALIGVAGSAAVANRRAVGALEARRRGEAERTARLVRGLSRSLSADAIVGAIARELAATVEADHVVVVRRRTDPARLEAMLVSARPGVASSTTNLPLTDIEAPLTPAELAGRRRAPVPVDVEVDMPAPALTWPTAATGATSDGTAAGAAPAKDRSAQAAASPDTARAPATAPGGRPPLGAGVGRGGPGHARPAGSGRDPVAAARLADRLADRVASIYGLRDTLSAPIVVDATVVGALVLSRRTVGPWPAATRRFLDEAAGEASIALGRAEGYRAAELRASTDALTGLPNRRYFDEFCGLLARRRRSRDAVGVMMVDIDHFKRLNDRYGHATGDEVLRAVAQAIATAVRDDDVPARYGGEEFVVLLRNPTAEVATEIGERARGAVGRLDLAPFGVSRVTVSVGVAVQRVPDEPIDRLVERADQALYRAKKAGRDRVIAG
jgi:diguanylate cyclase (GGDEF)-like protein